MLLVVHALFFCDGMKILNFDVLECTRITHFNVKIHNINFVNSFRGVFWESRGGKFHILRKAHRALPECPYGQYAPDVNNKSTKQIAAILSSLPLGGGNVVYLSVVKSYN